MYQWVVLGVTLIFLGFLIIRKPLWLVPLLGVALALEISEAWYPNLEVAGKTPGMVSLMSLTSIALILAAFFRLLVSREMRQKFGALLKDPLTIILLIFLLLGAASVVYSADPGKTVAEARNLLFLFAVFLAIALLIDKERALLPFKAVHMSALALSPIVFYEGFFGSSLWQINSVVGDQVFGVKATFSDPDLLARYLILGIAANFVIQLYTREKGLRTFYMASLAVLLAQLALTYSPGGILTLGVVLIAALVFMPDRKAVLWVLGLAAFCGALVLFIRPDIWAGLIAGARDFAVLNPQRAHLWQAAIAVFQDNLILGSGLGSFQTVFLADYLDPKIFQAGTAIPHTALLTIAAELGVLGLTVLSFLGLVLLGRLYTLSAKSSDYLSMFNNYNNEYYVGAGYFLWIFTVFINSQIEGRFLEDPIFWLSCALLVVLKLNREYNIRLD